MKTKEKIIQSALRLYNQKGLYNVSSRDICRDLSISPGNFSYHYPSIQRLCTDLFSRLIQALESIDSSAEASSIIRYLDQRKAIMLIQYHYRFFYLNLYDTLQKFEGIKDFYVLHYQEENAKIIKTYQSFAQQNQFKQALSPSQLKGVQQATQILQNSWLIDASLQLDKQLDQLILEYLYQQIQILLVPYLREKSQQIVADYFRNLS